MNMAGQEKNDIMVIDHPRLILGAIGLAMGIAVFALTLLKSIEPTISVLLLSIAVICFGISALIPRR